MLALLALLTGCGWGPEGYVPRPTAPAPPSRAIPRTTVAVLPWSASAPVDGWDGLGAGLGGLVTTRLVAVEGLVLVERARLDALIDEIALGDSGFVDPTTAQRLGAGLGAELLVVGSYQIVAGDFVMDGRLVRVASGEVVSAGSARAPLAEWDRAASEVVDGLVHELGARLDVPAPVPPPPLESVAAYGRGVTARREGDVHAAREAFQAAGAWAPAVAERADVEGALARAVADIASVAANARRDALAALPPPAPHGAPTGAEAVDLTLRWALLADEQQWCPVAAEQHTWLQRSGWRAPRAGRGALERRRAALGLDDDPVVGRFGFDAVGDGAFLFGPDAIDVREGWLASVQRCDPDLGRVADAWREAIAEAPDALHGGLPLRFHLEAGHAWLLARHTGTVPDRFPDAVRAVGSPKALALAEEVRDAARGFRFRAGLTDAELVALAQAVQQADPTRVDPTTDPCRSWIHTDARTMGAELSAIAREGLAPWRAEQLGRLAWVYRSRGCLVGHPARFADARAVIDASQTALAGDPACAREASLGVAVDVHGRLLGLRAGDAATHERELIEALRAWERCRDRTVP